MDKKDEIYNPKDIAEYLLLNNDNMNNLSSRLFTMEKGIYNTKYEFDIYGKTYIWWLGIFYCSSCTQI